jgi:hypothetical protein
MNPDLPSQHLYSLLDLNETKRSTAEDRDILAVWDVASLFGKNGQTVEINLTDRAFRISSLHDSVPTVGRICQSGRPSTNEWIAVRYLDSDLEIHFSAGYRSADGPLERSLESTALAARLLSSQIDSVAIAPEPYRSQTLLAWAELSGMSEDDLVAHLGWMEINAYHN